MWSCDEDGLWTFPFEGGRLEAKESRTFKGLWSVILFEPCEADVMEYKAGTLLRFRAPNFNALHADMGQLARVLTMAHKTEINL